MSAEDETFEAVETGSGDDARSISRRSALKKAAAAASVAGVVWAAPAVEGLSIIPDYTAAALSSVHGLTVNVKFGDTNGPTYSGDDNYFYYQATPGVTASSNSPNQNQAITFTANLGAAGTAKYTLAAGQLADGDGFNGAMTFNVGPHNLCRITAINSHPGFSSAATWGTIPATSNTPSTYTQNFTVGNHPGPATRVDYIQITINCA
jgi:hypothetical protein